jgi:16S rRNA (cytidine1402-2'-O)-methyltransferase
MGNRYGVLAREMTKLHEEFIRGRLLEILEILEGRSEIKGECTLLISGCEAGNTVNWETVRSEIRNELESKNEPVSRLAQEISQKYGLSKNKVYQEALKIRKQMTEF